MIGNRYIVFSEEPFECDAVYVPGAYGYYLVNQSIEKDLHDLGNKACVIDTHALPKSKQISIVFDLDSTLIQQETIDELARVAGVYERVSEITRQAMEGQWDFAESLRKRVLLLEGVCASEAWNTVLKNLVYTKGAHELCKYLKENNITAGIVSGGFDEMVKHVAGSLGADHFSANALEIIDDKFTGKLTGSIVDGEYKKKFLSDMPGEFKISVGDGANDIPMLLAADLGISFMGKPLVRQSADIKLNIPSLLPIIDILNIILQR